jgi:phosphoglycolate phosphatase
VPRPAALFDLDGVLADSAVPITSCVNHALKATGHGERPVEELYAFIGPPTRIGFAALTGTDPDSAEVEACVAAYRECYDTALWQTPAYPGVPDVVRDLAAQGWALGVATSKPIVFAEPVLEAIGLRDAFATVAGPDLTGTADKRQSIATALAGLPGDAVAVAMVGDRRYDMEGARHHGLVAVGATWGFGTRRELSEAGADVLVDDAAQLADALREATRARLATSSWTTGP